MHTASQHDAEEDPQEPRIKAELRRQNGADKRARAGDGREMMTEEDETIRRVEVLSVLERVCRRDARVVETEHFCGQERRVVAIGNREDRERSEHPPRGMHEALLPQLL